MKFKIEKVLDSYKSGMITKEQAKKKIMRYHKINLLYWFFIISVFGLYFYLMFNY